MPLVDDLALPVPEEELDRRKALSMIGTGALLVAAAGTAVTAVRYLAPNVLYEAASKFKAGLVSAIGAGAVLAFPRQKAYVLRGADGIYALSATCTHLCCMTRYEPENGRIFCPCHGSQFALDGTVKAGPAPKPLPRLKVAVESGVLVVDTRTPAADGEVVKG